MFDVQLQTVAGELARVQMGEMQLELPASGNSIGAAKLAVRPDRVVIHPTGTDNTLPATVQKCTYVGSHVEYRFDTSFGGIFAVSHEVSTRHTLGDSVAIGFAAHGPVLLPPES